MFLKKLAKLVILGFVLLGMVGCSSSSKKSPTPKRDANDDFYASTTTEDTYAQDAADCRALARESQASEAVEFYGQEISPCEEKDLIKTKIIYFPYDQYYINETSRMHIMAHARKLLNNKNLAIRIEGHADERGSREYNIALGEKRAKAVARVLIDAGVSSDRLTVVSYGKEKPAVTGHGENSWAKNRRVELVYERY